MSKQKRNLLIVAHPDDETIFFAGALLQITTHPWDVVCVTDGNADGQGQTRKSEFAKACRTLRVKNIYHFGQPDIFEQRLDAHKIHAQLQALPLPAQVFTHGPLGEYGHPHHQDIAWAAHNFYLRQKIKVWSPAYNCFAEKKINLTPSQYKTKTKILSEVYFNETKRHIHFLPANSAEGYVQAHLKEVNAIYEYLTGVTTELNAQTLKHYKWHAQYIENFKKMKRPF